MSQGIAVVDGSRAVSHAELADRVAARREVLRAAGVGSGQRVALLCRPDVDTLVGQLALLEAGATLIPLNGELTAAERAGVVEQCAIGWIAKGEQLVQIGERPPARSDAALGLLSSGSTGTPKLVLVSRAQFEASLDIYRRAFDLSPDDRLLALAPVEHGFGLRFAHAMLSAGGSVILPASHHPRAVLEQAVGATLVGASPRLLELLAGRALPGVRAAVAAGGVTKRAQLGFTGAPLWQSYGASEVGSICLNRDGFASGELLALGPPNPGVTIELLDGEIVVRSTAVGLGYEGDPGDSAIRGDRFWSGDLARWHEGRLVFMGRKKLLIATGADKVDPSEVEAVLRRHAGIVDAAVVGVADGGGEFVKAILVAPEPVPFFELLAFCARELSPHKLPRLVEYRDALPRDALGKLRRGDL